MIILIAIDPTTQEPNVFGPWPHEDVARGRASQIIHERYWETGVRAYLFEEDACPAQRRYHWLAQYEGKPDDIPFDSIFIRKRF